jgi:hypothetical protein
MEVREVVLNLPISSSVGPDEIPTSLLRSCVDNICTPLCDVINNIFESGVFANQLEIAKK